MQEVEEVRTTIVKKIKRDAILPRGATLISLELLFLLGWALKMGKLYAMKKYVERFRSSDKETAAAAALELSNIDAAQEESMLEKKNTKNISPERLPGRNELQKVAPEKLVSRLVLWNVRFIWC